MDQSAISRALTVAGGRFAPGHLGELTRQVPFEMVDEVLERTRRVQRRARDLPARVVVYLLLGGCLFAELGYPQVWRRLAAGLAGLPVAAPTASAMTQARRRLGAGPLRELFALPRGPAAAEARWRGLLVVAIDGTIMTVADSEANLAVYSKQRGGPNGGSGYPMLRLLALVSCGTRTVIDAVFGPVSAGELSYAAGLLGSLRAGMVLLADRNFRAGLLAAQVAGTGADFLIRVRTGTSAPGLPVLTRLPDGSWLSRFGGIPVRVIDAQVTCATTAGRAASRCRLVTTLLGAATGADPDRASFCVALNAARDQAILAAGVFDGPAADLVGTIGRLVLASLMPGRRPRTSPRAVKRAISKYNARGNVDRTTRNATIAIAILAAPLTSGDEP